MFKGRILKQKVRKNERGGTEREREKNKKKIKVEASEERRKCFQD